MKKKYLLFKLNIMSKQEYNNDQIEELWNNSNIKKCSKKYITFTDEFKLEALKLDKQWIIHREIFRKFWFPEYIIKSTIPEKSLKNWRYKAKHKWIESLQNTKKWRKKKEIYDVSKMTKDEELEYLRTKVTILEELKKLVDWGYP